MAVYWCTEAIPIAATALLPFALMPWLGIITATDVAKNYLKVSGKRISESRVVSAAEEIHFAEGATRPVSLRFTFLGLNQKCNYEKKKFREENGFHQASWHMLGWMPATALHMPFTVISEGNLHRAAQNSVCIQGRARERKREREQRPTQKTCKKSQRALRL